ncbi:DUF2798 domain-containing protein [Rhizobium herbae]|uniref:DUF2798 domain-containing protein n=1 Tax=Rhizobium herbae TaxID=508661 RepID=A0ABS4EP51_9HYPH|nr:DUF2798 domain-containing protein [Rhizobium herbae]MBP1859727.1 hypothetical protein [Rhizobium herbae]
MTQIVAPDIAGARSRKLPKRTAPVVFAFLMALIMAFLMCCVIVAASDGITAGYMSDVLKAYSLAMPAAFVCVLIVRPLVARLVPLFVQVG